MTLIHHWTKDRKRRRSITLDETIDIVRGRRNRNLRKIYLGGQVLESARHILSLPVVDENLPQFSFHDDYSVSWENVLRHIFQGDEPLEKAMMLYFSPEEIGDEKPVERKRYDVDYVNVQCFGRGFFSEPNGDFGSLLYVKLIPEEGELFQIYHMGVAFEIRNMVYYEVVKEDP